jgi:hypothetical protein
MVGAEPLGADGERVGQVNVVGSIVWKRSGKESLAFRRDRFADPFFRLRADLNTAGIIFLLAGSLTFVAVRFTPIFNGIASSGMCWFDLCRPCGWTRFNLGRLAPLPLYALRGS